MNPIQAIKNIINAGKNPEEVVLNALGNNNNPNIKNLLKMAKNNDYEGVEKFTRNILKEQGRDFDKELAEIKKLFNL